jgi:glutamate dehydrogenase/leucine dehydrogenase
MSILNTSPEDFAGKMQAAGIDTGFIVNVDGKVISSGDLFKQVADEVVKLDDYRAHEGVFVKWDASTSCLFMVFVHSTVRGQGQGGTRLKYRDYEMIGGAFKDGLRLSKGMTDKNSISRIWWGGGKALICPVNMAEFDKINSHSRDADGKKVFTHPGSRTTLFKNYGAFVASLGGPYIAAEDMNTTPEDMQTILSVCRYVTCLPASVGGSNNPSRWTAEGVFNALMATIKHYENKDDLTGKTVAIQGVGSVGGPLAEFVLQSGGSLVIFDFDADSCKAIKAYDNNKYADKVTIVSSPEEVYLAQCDIFAPCAIGGILNKDTIPNLKCKYVVGAANNQLGNFDEDYKLLRDRGIVYVPDFYINRMGIINCANEQYGRLENDLKNECRKIYDDPSNGTIALLQESEAKNKTPQEIAIQWAIDWGKQPHPIWGHRGIELIKSYCALNN